MHIPFVFYFEYFNIVCIIYPNCIFILIDVLILYWLMYFILIYVRIVVECFGEDFF